MKDIIINIIGLFIIAPVLILLFGKYIGWLFKIVMF